VSAGHDDGELDLKAKLQEPDEDTRELLVSEIVDWSRVVSEIKQIHCVGSALYRKGVGAKGIEDLQDRVKHRGSEGTSDRVVAESHAEIAVHGSRVESSGVTIAKGLEGFFILGAPGEQCSSIINMRVDNDECSWISRTSDLELARITFELEVSQREEKLGMVIVKYLVRNASAIDAAEDLHVGVTIGLREVSGEAAIVWYGERQLEESSWDIITPHLEAVEVTTMDSCSKDGIDSEQEEVVVASGSVRGLSVGRRGSGFHCTESC